MNKRNITQINEHHAIYKNIVGNVWCNFVMDLHLPDDLQLTNTRWVPKICGADAGSIRYIESNMKRSTEEEFFDHLMTKLPDVFEFLLWHPELL